MRENMGIYRGERVDNGEMVEGFYSCVTDNYTPKNRCYITTFKSLDNGEIVLTGQFEVIPETVGQFIGLTDKNEKKIFEGDIVKQIYDDDLAYIVTWDEMIALFYLKCDRGMVDFYHCFGEELSIIGNIHDNPELLTATKTEGYADNSGLMPTT